MSSPAVIDHVVIRAATLDAGAAYVDSELGIDLAGGGAHAAMGTHNLLAGVDGPYLEVIAVDPAAPSPDRPRWFALDETSPAPALTAWVVRVSEPVDDPRIGVPLALARGDLTWRIAVRDDGSVPFDGAGPLLITWESAPPALEPSGARLVSLIAISPEAGRLGDFLDGLDLAAPVSVQAGEAPRLIAAFDSPRGPRLIASDGGGIDVIAERQAAMDLFHRTWRFLDREDRAPEHDAAMIACAEASLWHWRRVGAPTQWAIGEWQCSRAHAVLGDGERALAHARACLDIAEADRVDDFVPASAHEALSRAYAVLGDFDTAREERNIAYRIALELDDEDRDVIEHDLGTIPIPA
ncbi:MAG: hypothetical protein RL134_475 [Actinomycetota bacterium]